MSRAVAAKFVAAGTTIVAPTSGVATGRAASARKAHMTTTLEDVVTLEEGGPRRLVLSRSSGLPQAINGLATTLPLSYHPTTKRICVHSTTKLKISKSTLPQR